ncbi:helix-turn-helix transcriptional regulator [Ralstonia insidiosa]|uniref:helix-turn-helix transcriptional regulator n=1 Tax=Ralstonia insidiosa TaxID=190721 RepID=UPI000CEEEC6A|nr:AlpA family transcriptional regulator [Ralstonia insidiosa]
MKAINIKQVAEKVSLGQSTLYRMIAAGEFPKPFSLAGNQKRWLEEDIDEWLAEKAGKPSPRVASMPQHAHA